MIEARFGFKRRPFDKSIASRDLYRWPGLDELDARLEMIKQARGVLLLTGEPGTGKTVALRRFVDSLNVEHYLPVYLAINNPYIMGVTESGGILTNEDRQRGFCVPSA